MPVTSCSHEVSVLVFWNQTWSHTIQFKTQIYFQFTVTSNSWMVRDGFILISQRGYKHSIQAHWPQLKREFCIVIRYCLLKEFYLFRMTVIKVSIQGITINRKEYKFTYHVVLFSMEHATTIPHLKKNSFHHGYYPVIWGLHYLVL